MVIVGGKFVMNPDSSQWTGIAFLSFWLLFFALLLTVSVATLVACIELRKSAEFSKVVLSVYFSHNLCFTTAYFIGSLFGDYNQVVSEYIHYEYSNEPFLGNRHHLRGLEYKLWSPPEDFVLARRDGWESPDIKRMKYFIKGRKRDEFLQFDLGSLPFAYLEHFYFSTVTITTLGYGDICPNNLFAKLTVALQVLSGVILLSFILTLKEQSPAHSLTSKQVDGGSSANDS